ncbi:MAG: OmpA family protein [Deltaproteobacteria bacterium]|nr:OmpA family protein [Deltaproteobacteria bacterium]
MAPAEACGVKLLLRTGAIKPHEGVRRSSNPSRILVIGDPPRKFVRELKEAGHQVDVAESANASKSKDYKLVVTSSAQVADARGKFPNATVVASTTVSQVEANVARERVGYAAARTPVASRADRTPVAAGPVAKNADYGRLVGSKPVDETTTAEPKPVVAEPVAPKPKTVAATESNVPKEPKPVVATEPVAPKPKPVVVPEPVVAKDPKPVVATEPVAPKDPKPVAATRPARDPAPEITFGFNGAALTSDGHVGAWVKWLNANPGSSIVIEGHTDSSGDDAYNTFLSQKRAEAVRDYLVREGIDASRMEIVAHGESQPKYGDGADPRNRRVAIVKK